MKVVILAAGPATRLLPLTKDIPKCLVKINGRPLIEMQLEMLLANGLTDITIVVGHHGDQVKKHIGSRAQYIENKEYLSTNSAFSLWLAREQIREGFIHLNGDLIVHKHIMAKLLAASEENAIMINRKPILTSDMQKVSMDGNLIKHMSKDLPEKDAVAEAVGPAKFSRQGANKLIEQLNELNAQGERNHWAYSVFSDFSKKSDFIGIDIGDLDWIEIDDHKDMEDSKRRFTASIS